MELDRKFDVIITKAIPNDPNGYETFEFNCGSSTKDKNGSYFERGEVRVIDVQGGYKNNCDISIYGLGYKTLSQLTFLTWNPIKAIDSRNTIKITVDGETVFYGNIVRAFADFNQAPEICLRITGAIGLYAASITEQAMEVKASQNRTVKSIFTELGAKAKVATVVNKSIANDICPDVILDGSIYDRIVKLAKKLGYQFDISSSYLRVTSEDGVLGFSENDDIGELLKVSKSKNGGVPNISYENGLIGYPTFSDMGITFRAIFDPKIHPGNIIMVDSIVPGVMDQQNKEPGAYIVSSKSNVLSTLPNGKWESEYICKFIPSIKKQGE